MRRVLLLSLLPGAVASAPADAQSLASRVARAPDGVVRMEVASRPGTCGDGRDVIGYRNALFARNFQSIGRWHHDRCVPGPLRVRLAVADGHVTQLRTQVGGAWPGADGGGRVTDLGVVPAGEAATLFFALVPQLETAAGRDRLLLPAVLADDPVVVPPLLALARDRRRTEHTRRDAMQWLGIFGDEDPAAGRYLRTIVEDDREPQKMRSHAIFALTHGGDVPDSEFAYLRGLYARLDEELKEAVHFGMTQDEGPGGRWLIERATDARASLKLRKNALFWAGQREATPTADLARVYRDAGDTDLREHAIFVLSQRHDDAATDSLLGIARSDGDAKMRGKALFWLAQKDDPRVRKLIADLILR